MTRSWFWSRGRWHIGADFMPYQFAVGVSARRGEFAGLRLYCGPVKLHASWGKP